ncbi:MAG TPA: ABC transporter substrate-binding protein [Xanthobacteraceae bacterium]|jgi:ABC-type nitrate/sulfonate/bicarbonate transport system substrate-binding protein
MRIAAVDLISNTCFPLLAADELGFFEAEGLDVEIELLPSLLGTRALHDGTVDLLAAGSVYDLLTQFPDWRGSKIVVALSQGTPWLLVVRADLDASRGDINAVKGLRLTAAEGPDQALRQMLLRVGIDPGRDLDIVELPGARGRNVSFGVFAARALEAGQIDGFWANALGAELAVGRGAGKVLIDVRRGDDPQNVRFFTFAALATTDAYLERERESVERAVRAVVKAQARLRADPSLARKIGAAKFPADAAELIARTIERDIAFYDPAITQAAVLRMNAFAQSIGHLSGPVPYDHIVDLSFRRLWVA